jgi:hypothetical protein
MKFSNDSRPFRSVEASCQIYGGVVLMASVLLLQGCAQKQVHARPWATAIAVRPHLTHPVQASVPDLAEVEAPELSGDFPPLSSPLSISRQPVRPRVAVQPTPETSESRKPPAPLLEPELTPQEVATAQQQLNESTAIAQKNLNSAKGRSLNATQADLTSKVVAFLQESKQAVREGDWTRARNLAKKAQVLSEELAASL